jgi:RND family efflux transporter MFP subunit
VASDAEIDQGRRSVMAAENTLMTLRSQLERANLDLSRTQIAAPIDGVVVSDSVEEGDFVRRGTALVTIEDTASVEVKCSLQTDELYWLWNQAASNDRALANKSLQPDYEIPNAPAKVIYRLAGRGYQWSGELARYEGIGLDETTRTVPCRVVVESPRQRVVRLSGSEVAPDQATGPPALVRGMYVTVRIEADPRAKLLDIPEEAVRPGNKVWVCRDGTLAIVDVDVVQVTDEVAIIRPGQLRGGEKVVVSLLAAVEPGMAIREQSDP